MLVKGEENRDTIEMVSLDMLVPKEHLLRKIDAAVDFHRIYEFVDDLYCKNNGRPSIDPVVLFKIVMIQHIYGIPSLRRTLEEVNMNVAYRWFIGYPLNEQVPHFSTVSYNFKHRFTGRTVEYIFRWILGEAANEGFLDTSAIFIDGTHIKASANIKKKARKAVPVEAKRYTKELRKEINKDREEHEKSRLMMITMTIRHLQRKKKLQFQRLIQMQASFIKVNIRSVLLMKHIQLVTSIILFSM